MGYGVSFGDDENVLKLDRSGAAQYPEGIKCY